MKPRHVDILLVEDNPADVRLMKEILKDSSFDHELHVVVDGEEAMSFLRQKGKYSQAPRPGFILLDLNLPRKDGREVLAEVKNDPDLKQIPIVVLTSSKSDDDIDKSYSLHANCYLTKPTDLEMFTATVKAIENFWFALAKLPEK